MILGGARPPRLLLDTCAVIYLFNGEAVASDALNAIAAASILISPVSAWEIGLLGRRGSRSSPVFRPNAGDWFRRALTAPNVSQALFDAEIALASNDLPEPFHRDPADRFLVATARQLIVPIMTRDRLILDYAAVGHLDAIAC